MPLPGLPRSPLAGAFVLPPTVLVCVAPPALDALPLRQSFFSALFPAPRGASALQDDEVALLVLLLDGVGRLLRHASILPSTFSSALPLLSDRGIPLAGDVVGPQGVDDGALGPPLIHVVFPDGGAFLLPILLLIREGALFPTELSPLLHDIVVLLDGVSLLREATALCPSGGCLGMCRCRFSVVDLQLTLAFFFPLFPSSEASLLSDSFDECRDLHSGG